MAVFSLLVLIGVVALGFIKKVNLGFLSLGAAFILGTCGGMKAKAITANFNVSLFVTLVGVTFLFGMASQNGTLDLFAKKCVAAVGKRTVFIPVLMFFLSAFISAIGPGHIAAGILMTTFAIYLAFEMKINPVTTALFAKLGANAGCASPLSITGVVAQGLTDNEIARINNGQLADPTGTLMAQLQSYNSAHIFLTTLISGFIFTLIIYVCTKSYKVKADNPLKLSDIPAFNKHQRYTIFSIVAMVILCIGFKFDTGLTAFVAGAILVLLGAADEKKAIKGIPWGTLILICGVGTLVGVISKLGGIQLISDTLSGMMTEGSATTIVAASSGIMSWVSSTVGVVMPTLFPIGADTVVKFAPHLHWLEITAAITATSFAAAVSPLSTGGAIIMSSINAIKEASTEENNRMFKNLFLLSVGNVLLNVLFAFIGLFSLGGIFYAVTQ